jgi:hypothetical protein
MTKREQLSLRTNGYVKADVEVSLSLAMLVDGRIVSALSCRTRESFLGAVEVQGSRRKADVEGI